MPLDTLTIVLAGGKGARLEPPRKGPPRTEPSYGISLCPPNRARAEPWISCGFVTGRYSLMRAGETKRAIRMRTIRLFVNEFC